MKTFRLLFCAVPLIALLPAQPPAPGDPGPIVPLVAALSAEQLDQLLAPIALYPDALIALILPAATNPTDVVLAARHLKENANDLAQVEHRAWDESVKSLTHYPDVLAWMDENLPWTKQVGEAFALQPADVMNSIQRLRTRAQASGVLVNTPQQQVLSEPNVIRIVPSDPEIIYVPRYDPAVVFVDYPTPSYYTYAPPLMSFGLGWRVGSWLAYDFDWNRCTLWVGDRHRPWQGRHDWRRPVVPIPAYTHTYTHRPSPSVRPWQPSPRSFRPLGSQPTVNFLPGRPVAPNSSSISRTFGRSDLDERRPGTSSGRPAVNGSRTNPGSRTVVSPPATVSTPTVTSVTTPPAPGTTPASSNRGASRENRQRGRNDGENSRPTAAPLPTAPPLTVVGQSRSERPTVAPAPSPRSAPQHYSRSAGLTTPPANSGTRTTGGNRTFSPPAVRPAPAAPAAPVVSAPAPVASAPAAESRPASPPSGGRRGQPRTENN